MTNEEKEMYGCTVESMKQAVEGKHVNLPMYIAGILSDAQEVAGFYPDVARKYMNKVKFYLFTYMDTRSATPLVAEED
jgi:hypothetical protein